MGDGWTDEARKTGNEGGNEKRKKMMDGRYEEWGVDAWTGVAGKAGNEGGNKKRGNEIVDGR